MRNASGKIATPIYKRIKTAFKEASDGAIARELGATKSAVSQWKSGGTKPSDSTLLKVEEMTGTPIKYLQTGDPKYLLSMNGKRQKTVDELPDEPITLKRFATELQELGVEDFNPAKGMKALTPDDMREILAVVKTMVEQKIKAKG